MPTPEKECQIDHCLEITRTLNKANAEFKNSGYTRFRPHLLIMMVEEYLKSDDKEAKSRALTLIYKCYELLDPNWTIIHTQCHKLMRYEKWGFLVKPQISDFLGIFAHF